MKILFVEDEVSRNLPLVKFFQLVEGWEVDQCTSAQEAVEALEDTEQGYDIVLLDVMMPPDESVNEERSEMGRATGLLVLEKLKEIYDVSLPVMLLTARQDLQEVSEDPVVCRYLKKPQTSREVVVAVKEVAAERGRV